MIFTKRYGSQVCLTAIHFLEVHFVIFPSVYNRTLRNFISVAKFNIAKLSMNTVFHQNVMQTVLKKDYS